MSRGRARPQLLRVEQTLFSECPLLGAPCPFIGPILKGSKGSRLMGWTGAPGDRQEV